MSIIAGTDFSESARGACRAAAVIAKRLQVPLKLVHVIDDLGAELAVAEHQDAIYDGQRETLANHAQELRAAYGIDVEPIAVAGNAEQVLVSVAAHARATLIVVSSLGRKKPLGRLVGSVAERVAQGSPVPVLVVRDPSMIEAWVRGERALRVMVGVELSSTSRAAVKWATRLRAIGRCDIVVAQIAWPFGEHLRLGVPTPMPLDQLRPEIHGPLLRDLRAWAGELPGPGESSFTVTPGWGRVDSHLTALAATTKTDLLVVGTHQRANVERLWQGSVSRGVLHDASCSVACVPRNAADQQDVDIPTFRRLLVPTDFSPLANRAIAVAYGLTAPGGTVHLLYVVGDKPGKDETDRCCEELRALVPPGAAARGIMTEVEVVKDSDPFMGIFHSAGRLGVDAVCMATHGRSGASQLVLGSQAQQVVRRVRQPVVLVPPEREADSKA